MKKLTNILLAVMLGTLVSGMIASCSKDDEGGTSSSANRNSNVAFGKADAMLLEVPHLRAGQGIYFVAHHARIKDGSSVTTMNYCMEYDSASYHTRWVAFSFNDTTKIKNVSRSDAWAEDVNIPSSSRLSVTSYTGSGYTRGHLCASADRLYSKQANEQTFYMSNMSPQLYDFNSYYWAELETLVRNWIAGNTFKRLYVCKGGTIRPDQLYSKFYTTNARGVKVSVVVPKYYFMAILAETPQSTFQAIGFVMEHKNYPPYTGGNYPAPEVMKQHAMSIDQLEDFTGIDFFCNLNDALENAVEKTCNLNAWAWH